MQHSKIKNFIKITGISLILLGLSACDLRQEPNLPSWTNTIEFPLTRDTVALGELLDDQEEIGTQLYDGDSIYAFSQEMAMDGQEVGDQLILDDLQQSFTQSVDDVSVAGSEISEVNGMEIVGVDPIQQSISSQVGTIELADIPASTTDPFQLNEIVPSIDLVPDGNAIIPEEDLVPVSKPFTFDNFQSADFSGGSLNITITNNMVIALGNPINIQLQEDTGTDTVDIPGALVTFATVIPTGTDATEVMDLTGLTLPGSILVEISGHSVGSEGNSIPIDDAARTSSFFIEIEGAGLQVSSASAQIPEQSINETGEIEMAESENQVERATIDEGNLEIDIDNNLSVDAELTITIISLEDPGNTPLSETIQLTANTDANRLTDLNDYFLVMHLDTQVVRYEYEILTEDTDPNFVTISETDSVVVNINLYGETVSDQMTFRRITGIIEPQIIEDSGEINVTSDSKILAADIAEGDITIQIDNRVNEQGFGGQPKLVLTIPEFKDTGGNSFTDSLTLEAGSDNVLEIAMSDYTLVFPDTIQQNLTYTTRVSTPEGELGRYNLDDSIYVNILVDTLSFSQVTGFFTQDAMVEESTIELTEGTKVLQAVFREGQILMTITNGIGIEADVAFVLDEFIHRGNSSSFAQSLTITEDTAPQTFGPFSLSDYDLILADAQPGAAQEIHYSSTISIPSDNEMTLTFGDSLVVDVDITGLTLQSVTGIIEADTLEIEPTEQSIELPDLVADLQFEEVEILIDFDTGLTVPITLSLSLTASGEEGDTTITVTQNITENDSVYIEGAEALINLHPSSIVASGLAIVGDGVTPGTVAYGDTIGSTMYIRVPLSLYIDDPPYIEADPTELDSPFPEDSVIVLEGVTLYALVRNEFDFGARVNILVSEDPLAFDSLAQAQNTAPIPDTLLTLELAPQDPDNPNASQLLDVVLTDERISLLERDNHLQTQFKLLGQLDGDGNPAPSRFLTTDSLTLQTWGTLSYKVDPEAGN